MKTTALVLLGLSFTTPLFATKNTELSHAVSVEKYDQEIDGLYHSFAGEKNQAFGHRLRYFSRYFLGKPYVLGPLGEGATGRFDQHPLYRTDVFDCTTFVSTVLALSLAPNLDAFKTKIRQVRYDNAKVSFGSRNHFMTVDWNINNATQGFIEDITTQIKDKQGKSIAVIAEATIDKPGWYKKMTASQLHLHHMGADEKQERLQQLKQLANQQTVSQGRLYYLPLNKLFDAQGKPNAFLFKQIPGESIIEIVRPNWDLNQKIGTHLNVSHLGFAIRDHRGLIFRQASTLKKRVSDGLLSDYLANYLKSPTVKGINIQRIVTPSKK